MIPNEAERDRLRLLMIAAGDTTACLSAEVLARVAAGEASRAERRATVDHLATCSLCSDEYRVAATLAGWSRSASSQDLLVDRRRSSAPSRRSPSLRTHPLALAATFAAMLGLTAALIVWSLSLREENTRLTAEQQESPAAESSSRVAESGPRLEAQAAEIAQLHARLEEAMSPALNVPIVDLMPRDRLRGPSSPVVVRVPAASRVVTFVITTASDPAPRDHELEIIGPSNEVLWRGSGLRPNAEGTFTATIPRSLLPSGTSRLRLSIAQNGGRRTVSEYDVRVES